MASIGQQLTTARNEIGLSVDDVAHETRIHANVIRSIEEDDFSMFASTTYARSFLKKYSDYLEIDVTEEIHALDSGTEVSLKNSELMDQVRDTLQNNRLMRKEQPRRYRRRIEKPGGAPVFLGFILVLLFVSIGVFYFLGYQAESPEEFKSEITKNINKAGDILKTDEPANLPANPATDIPPNPLAPKIQADPVAQPQQQPALVETTPANNSGTTENPLIIAKPVVNMKLDESPLGEAEADSGETPIKPIGPPRPRETAALDLDRPAVIREADADLPALPSPRTPTPEQDGNSATPITDTVENPQPVPDPPAEGETPEIRAVPVSRSSNGQ